MFFIASKVFAFLTSPTNVLVLILILGTVLLFTRRTRLGRRLVAAATILLVIVGMSPLGAYLVRVLEDPFPVWDAVRGAPTGFIILGGVVDPSISAARHTTALDGSAERVTVVAELSRKYPAAKFIFTSGDSSLFGALAEADYVMPLFESFGIPPGRIVLERMARNTEENAEFSKILAAPKPGDRWVVITSAAHMPRSIGSFRAAGFEVEAYPVDWQTRGAAAPATIMRSFASGFAATDNAAHEYIGLLSYWLTGRSSELFPGPH